MHRPPLFQIPTTPPERLRIPSLAAAAVTALLLGSSLFATPALALVTQPNGAVVPIDSGSEVQLYQLFADQAEAIDWLADAHDTPDTFSPLCEFSATLVLKQSGSSLGVGWYNVVPGAVAPPGPGEIYQIVPPGSAVGTVIASADIREHPAYLGGDIGFALIRDPPHFSQSKWNTVCDQLFCAATPGPWILGLSYKSTTIPDAWYLAFEDGDTTNFSWNNDGDYNDYVFLFTGIVCSGAGQPCQVQDAQGVCLNGLTECDKNGDIVCKQLIEPESEACDGVDNDCDGEIDEDEDLCAINEVCVRGTCVPYCGEEFPCIPPAVCEGLVCVHPDCVGVQCDPGQACIEGDCRAPCDGVACPPPLVCRIGRCMDACAGIVCGDNLVCEQGACIPGCACQGCPDGFACRQDDRRCVDEACLQVTCEQGSYCEQGVCVDACRDAVCPLGQLCQSGACVEGQANAGAGGTGGAGGSSGPDLPGAAGAGAGGESHDAAFPVAEADGGSAGGAAPFAPGAEQLSDPACDCRTLPGHPAPALPVAPFALAVALWLTIGRWRRRRMVAGDPANER